MVSIISNIIKIHTGIGKTYSIGNMTSWNKLKQANKGALNIMLITIKAANSGNFSFKLPEYP